MKNLMIKKRVLCLLVGFVMALGVVGVVDALKLTGTSDTVQSQRIASLDGPFTIKFSVGLTGQKSINNTSNKRVNADDESTRIDSSGYEVVDLVIGRTYRIIHDTPNYSPSATGHKVGPRPEYSMHSNMDPLPSTDLARDPATPLYVDTSGNVFDLNGDAVYVQTGGGDRETNDDWDYDRLKARPKDPVPVSQRYDFNNEKISVQLTGTAANVSITDGLGYSVTTASSQEMGENIADDPYQRLKNSMTLTVRITASGSYTITIADATIATDYPGGQRPPTADGQLVFNLYVTDENVTDPDGDLIAFTTGERSLKRHDTSSSRENVWSHFDFSGVTGDTRIRYQVVKGSGTLDFGKGTATLTDVTAHKNVVVFLNTNNTTNEVIASVAGTDSRTEGLKIVFEYTGSGPPLINPTPTVNPVLSPTNPTLTLSSSTLTGNASTNVPLAATVRNAAGNTVQGIGVTFTLSTTNSGAILTPTAITNANGVAQTTVTLPNTNATVTVRATVEGVSLTQSASITVTGATGGTDTGSTTTPTVGEPSRLSISGNSSLTGEVNRRLDGGLTVRVVDANGAGVVSEVVSFRVTEGRGRLSPSRPRTDSSGYAEASFTPMSTGTIEVEAVLGALSPVTFTITTGEPPDAITKVSGDNQSGRPGAALANPFVVEVIDQNDDPVSGVPVTFAVTAGGGTLSTTSATTNNNGRTQTTLTLGSEPGDNTVAARVTGITGVNFTATSGAEVLVRAAQRPPMYWVGKADGTLHRLIDAEIENLAPSVQGVTSIAVDAANGLFYFAVQTGANKGTIRRAGLNGAGAQTLKRLTAVPMGIAVDSAGGTVYWTNSRGRIQSIATEGSTQLANVLQNLSNPGPIALSNGYLYWGESLGRVRRMSVTAAQAAPENIATGLGEPLSIAIAKGKVYWVERGAGGGGSLQRANLNGSNIEELKTFASGVPTSIVVDSSDNKIYWTKGTGKIQRSNLVGRFVKDIATGLMNPGSIALGTAAVEEEPVVEQTTQRRQQTQTDNSQYDVNGDGSVDNIDVTLVAVALGSSNAKYDVNGDGSVDANDLRAVIANTDDDAAAPAIDVDLTGLNLSADRIQEQIELLIASGDISLAGQRTLAYLQNLLTALHPDETVLLANYPNPFNPETWIPYHLADSTDVRINIYNAQGVLVRALTLGHQSAGYYTSRSRAAYWDGRNALGERVASGLYFYQLQTDEISPMRKMVILK